MNLKSSADLGLVPARLQGFFLGNDMAGLFKESLMAARAGGMAAAGIGEAAGSDLADYHLSSIRELLKACNG